MLISKKTPGSVEDVVNDCVHTWKNGGDVVEVADEFGQEILELGKGEFELVVEKVKAAAKKAAPAAKKAAEAPAKKAEEKPEPVAGSAASTGLA